MRKITVGRGVIQGCSWGTLFFNIAYARVIKQVREKFGNQVLPLSIHDDTTQGSIEPTVDERLVESFIYLKECGGKAGFKYGNSKDLFACYHEETRAELQRQLDARQETKHITVTGAPFKVAGNLHGCW